MLLIRGMSKMNSLQQENWDTNLDPFNWRTVSGNGVDAVWKKAVDTFLSPEVKRALSLVHGVAGKRVLLLGSGLGQGALPLAGMGAEVIGLDISPVRAAHAARLVSAGRESGRISFLCADALQFPFRDASFDLVIDQDVLMYTDPQSVARECERLLVPGGKVVFIESMRNHPFVSLFRKIYLAGNTMSCHYLALDQMKALGSSSLRMEAVETFYVLSAFAFVFLYAFRMVAMYRLFLYLLLPLDRFLIRILPILARLAWKGVIVYGKQN